MLRMLSSALGLLRSKWSKASYRIAAGCPDPGEKTANDESGTLCMRFEVVEVMMRRPSISVTR